MIDEMLDEIMAYEYHDNIKAKHRKTRKAKRKTQNRHNHFGYFIGKTASTYGKEMLHRYNRRVRDLDLISSDYYKHIKFSFSSILWDMT